MSLKSLKTFVAQLHSDAVLRKEFVANPDDVCSRYSLTRAEKTAMMRAQQHIQPDGTVASGALVNAASWWFG